MIPLELQTKWPAAESAGSCSADSAVYRKTPVQVIADGLMFSIVNNMALNYNAIQNKEDPSWLLGIMIVDN